ncbi:MAG: hypothetical protein HY319_00095 [Armatimonadetes bacterium]|nr:hypothetical protein [Armatimonadota bacterium]
MKISTRSSILPLARRPPAAAAAQEPRDTTREERIVHFVRELKRESLEHLRYLAAVHMGHLVATTAGVLLFAPLAVQLGQVHVLTVGATLMGGLGALAGYGLEKRRGGLPIDSRALQPFQISGRDVALAAATGLGSFPRFLYPTVQGASPEQKRLILDTLDSLPMGDVTSVSGIQVIPDLDRMGVSGVAPPALSQNLILLDGESLSYPSWARSLIVHEVGHSKDMTGSYGPIGAINHRSGLFGPFGREPFVSEYAGTNRFEDFADTHELYHADREFLERGFPDKFRVMDEAHRPTVEEWLVDRPAAREAGKQSAEAIGRIPYLRNGLELATALIAPFQIYQGAAQLEKAFVEGDEVGKLHGKLAVASGALLLQGGAPLAVAASALHLGLAGYARTPEAVKKANRLADGFLALAAGPAGMMARAIGSELRRSGIDLDQARYQPGEFQGNISGGGFLKGMLATLGGAVGGAAVGSAVGAALGGVGGAALGAFYGRMAGGLLGLGTYGVLAALRRSEQDDPLALRPGDKRFLGRIVGGALAGGAVGAVSGSLAGERLGSALGAAIAGPVGASVGSLVGGGLGLLAGSYALAAAGAALGRGRPETPSGYSEGLC